MVCRIFVSISLYFMFIKCAFLTHDINGKQRTIPKEIGKFQRLSYTIRFWKLEETFFFTYCSPNNSTVSTVDNVLRLKCWLFNLVRDWPSSKEKQLNIIKRHLYLTLVADVGRETTLNSTLKLSKSTLIYLSDAA